MYSRRDFLRVSSLLGGAVVLSTALSGRAASAGRETLSAATFAHGIASGDPLSDGVILWTRATPEGSPSRLKLVWELSADEDFGEILRSGEVEAEAARDYTVKIDVRELAPGKVYFYRFVSATDQSDAGRAKTLPAAGVAAVRLAVMSCSNYPAGYFHVYREASRIEDLDAFVHLGDYIYEYGASGYATERAQELGRLYPGNNAGELYSLTDYRRRYALYRSDADLQAMHAAAPCIAVWDDHEVANDAWRHGAENHSAGEGDFAARKLAAVQAWYEWLPVRPPAGE
ncbi:MAG: alkaline phosphatase D family protein, partial [Chromatocurvus sp.]